MKPAHATLGVPKETKTLEGRVALTPDGVREFERAGVEVFIEKDAGTAASISDAEFAAAGATIVPTAADAWSQSMVV
ncbi:MAG: alanine dehydrogenase, partial [Ilumatobacteraceae bacterium]